MWNSKISRINMCVWVSTYPYDADVIWFFFLSALQQKWLADSIDPSISLSNHTFEKAYEPKSLWISLSLIITQVGKAVWLIQVTSNQVTLFKQHWPFKTLLLKSLYCVRKQPPPSDVDCWHNCPIWGASGHVLDGLNALVLYICMKSLPRKLQQLTMHTLLL